MSDHNANTDIGDPGQATFRPAPNLERAASLAARRRLDDDDLKRRLEAEYAKGHNQGFRDGVAARNTAHESVLQAIYEGHAARVRELQEELKAHHAHAPAHALQYATVIQELQSIRLQQQADSNRLDSLAPLLQVLIKMDQATQTILARIDAATTDIAGDIRTLKDKIATGMPQAEVDALKAELEAKASRLESIAADTENPVPVEPNPPVEPPVNG